MSWIFGPLIDLSFMLIGIIVFVVTYFLGDLPFYVSTPLLFIALVLFDSGHVYLTYIRLYKEWRLIKTTTILLHLGLFLFFLAFQYMGIRYLWHFVVYATFFHFVRQFYGVMRWYLFLDKNRHTYILDVLFYLITLTPFVCLHLRPDLDPVGYYARVDTFQFASEKFLNIFKVVNIVVLASWFIYEVSFYMKHKVFELSRILYLVTTVILFNLVGFYATESMMIILPIVSAHGLQYYILLAEMVNKHHFFKLWKTILIVFFTGLIFGYLNGWGEEEADLTYRYVISFNLENGLMVALILTPLFAHYILDMVIWKRGFMLKASNLKNEG